ncbi:unnamed protein product [Echinostoma caproni]|uniref:EGF-like domain-containing protein n=1 Tax=Echinostoma caproni TaxID=27848 RepID=A0A183AJM6_9TREM|nr:unnamed protein product [Echinostoma caproni]
MQVWLGRRTILEVSCAAKSVQIHLIANRPIRSKTIWVEGVVGGEHMIIRYDADKSGTHAQCHDRDDEFGHYTCGSGESDQIRCLPGWQGKDCLDPICAPYCHPAGGWCLKPGECRCKRTWTGANCARCIPCHPNQCAYFSYYSCVCEYPAAQFTCNDLEKIEQSPNQESRQTIYHRVVDLDISYRFLSGAELVFYFYENLKDGTLERVAAHLQIKTNDCFSPAYQLGHKIQHRIQRRGSSLVDLFTIKLPSKVISSTGSDHCHVRTGLVDEHPGQSLHLLSWSEYMRMIEQVWGGRWKYFDALDTEEAFQLAGLLTIHWGLSSKLNLNSACPHMTVSRKEGTDLSHVYMRQAQSQKQYFKQWNRFYKDDLYQPYWIFDSVNESDRSDGFSYFRFTLNNRSQFHEVKLYAYCMTSGLGLWIGETDLIRTTWGLTINFNGPSTVAQNEVPYFRVMLHLVDGFPCGQIELSVLGTLGATEDMTPPNVTLCICPEETHELHFAKAIYASEALNLTITAKLWSSAILCSRRQIAGGILNTNSKRLVTKFQSIVTVRVLERYWPMKVGLQALVCETVDEGPTVVLSSNDKTNSLSEAMGPIFVTTICSLNCALTLRAVNSVSKLISLDTNDKLYLIKEYLRNKQNPSDGCFYESGRKMPYSTHGENGRLSGRYDHVLLTSYVLLALQGSTADSHDPRKDLVHDDDDAIEMRRRAILCLKRISLTFDDTTLSNYAWALLTYSMSRDPLTPVEINSINIRRLTLNLDFIIPSDDTSLPMAYVHDNSDPSNPSRMINSLAMEATAYTYMTVSGKVSYEKQLHLIKYLFAHSEWDFESRLTHASSTVFQALVHFAKQNSQIAWFQREYVKCTSQIHPSGQTIVNVLRDSEQFIPMPKSLMVPSRTNITSISWTVENLVANQCALANTEFVFASRFMSAYNSRETLLHLEVHEIDRKLCTSPKLKICVCTSTEKRPNLSGTLVLEIWPPSSYSLPNRSSAFWQIYNQSAENRGKPRHIRFGRSGEVLVLFDGWTEEEIHNRGKLEDIRRCVSIRFRQVYHAENAQPLKLKAYDLHRLYPEARRTHRLPSCQRWYEIEDRLELPGDYGPVNRIPCPICLHIEEDPTRLAKALEHDVCDHRGDLLVFETVKGNFGFGEPVIMYTTRMKNSSSYWLTKVKLHNENCTCKLPKTTTNVFVFTSVLFDYTVRDSQFDFKLFGYTNFIHHISCGNSIKSVEYLINYLSSKNREVKCTQALLGLRIVLHNMHKQLNE